jgi:hypothetical protein
MKIQNVWWSLALSPSEFGSDTNIRELRTGVIDFQSFVKLGRPLRAPERGSRRVWRAGSRGLERRPDGERLRAQEATETNLKRF